MWAFIVVTTYIHLGSFFYFIILFLYIFLFPLVFLYLIKCSSYPRINGCQSTQRSLMRHLPGAQIDPITSLCFTIHNDEISQLKTFSSPSKKSLCRVLFVSSYHSSTSITPLLHQCFGFYLPKFSVLLLLTQRNF